MDDDLALAMELADAADRLAMDQFRSRALAVDTKPDLSPVTAVDRAIEELVRETVGTQRPEHSVLGEEYGGAVDQRGW
ncbi:MAG TPA: inositol monophosphatase family protein, partial [Dehalococcoidia bacterium]|nr:inositol monophosphatase family protein [Dehalococcoidia bacterium]